MSRLVWITWEEQPRNKSMADMLGADFYKIEEKRSFLLRYFFCIKRTIRVLFKKYDIVIVQNPSMILCAISAIFKLILGYKLVIDAHNAGIYPKEGRSKFLLKLNDRILKSSDLVIVTNECLVSYLKELNILSIPITDPLPKYDSENYKNTRIKNQIFIICSWSEDEPIQLYLDLAKDLPEYEFYFSGNYRKFDFSNAIIPENVFLLGFVDAEEYIKLLFTSLVTIDLTLRDSCLVCGAYESISAEVPVILTDNLVNQSTFSTAALYSTIDRVKLRDKVLESKDFDRNNIIKFKERYEKEYAKSVELFYSLLNAKN
ncbi:glycosyltransferase family protein [Salinimonas lutimaris]|uniref:glycosyltransferase n=1 Tax=Salinimonas lutimaris TaxID=914153 RepID=UPI0010C0D3BE|nr:glycosyltransferase [Salinimonas lutimaris]